MRTFKRLFSYLKYEWKNLSIGTLLLICATGLTIYAPIIASNIIDYVSIQAEESAPINMMYILNQFAIYLILTFLSSILGYIAYLILATSANKISKIVRDQAHEHMQNLPVSYFDNIPAGKISARIVNDTEVLRENFFNNFLTQIIINLLMILGVYIGMLLVSPLIAAWLILLIPFIILWQIKYMKKIQPINKEWRESISDINSKIAEIVQGVSIVQLFNQQDHISELFEQTNDRWMKSRIDSLKLEALFTWNFAGILKRLTTFLVMLFLGTYFTQGIVGFTIGTAYVIINYIDRLFDPITMIIRLLTLMQQALSAGIRVFELLDTKIEKDSDELLELTAGKVEFKDISFAYKEGIAVLKDINFIVNQGETVGLVGHTGSGKSSIINLLFRFYDPQVGVVMIDDQVIENFNRESIRQNMGIVLQEPYLFSGTILSNITMNNPDITEEMAIEALLKVGAKPMIDKLKDGVHEVVVEKGTSFSSGERQLISFARTLANNPKILILDEATSHIDTETEEVIRHAMKVVKEGRTTFIVAHRLSTIKDADQIIVLDKGQIIEQGSHSQLIKRDGTYSQMYNMQATMN